MLEQVVVAAVVHEVRRHGDLLLHHVREGQDRAVGVDLEELLRDLGVGRLVSLLVGGDGAADLRQLEVPVPLGQPGRVPVRDKGRPLLERRVDEPQIRAVLRPRVLLPPNRTKLLQTEIIISQSAK